MREFVFALLAGTIAIAWGSLILRRADALPTVGQAAGNLYKDVAGTLFNA